MKSIKARVILAVFTIVMFVLAAGAPGCIGGISG